MSQPRQKDSLKDERHQPVQLLFIRKKHWLNYAMSGGHRLPCQPGEQKNIWRIPKHIQDQRMDCDTHKRDLRGELDKMPFWVCHSWLDPTAEWISPDLS